MSNYETMKRLGLTGQDVVDKHPGGRPPKPAGTRAESHLHIRVETRRKAGYVKAAQSRGMKLSAWVIEQLDHAASYVPENPPA